VTSGGNNLIDFPENQLTKFCALYTVKKVNRGPKVCRQSFRLRRTRSRKKLKSQVFEGVCRSKSPLLNYTPGSILLGLTWWICYYVIM